jgi:pimeloyl-ACP methyl ester carboxylesterase
VSHLNNNLQFIGKQITIDKNNKQAVAPLFIYLPGMDGSGELFGIQAEALKRFFELKCLKIPTQDLGDWESLVCRSLALIKSELDNNLSREIYLCGESFGACLAIKIALAAPELFHKIILVNPASSFRQQTWLNWTTEIVQVVPDFIHQGATFGLLPLLCSLDKTKEKERIALLEAMRSLPQKIVSWRLSLLKNFAIETYKLKDLIQPILILASDRDLLLPSVREAQRLRKFLPHAKLEILAESGHACLLEREIKLDRILQQHNFI